MYIFSTFNSNIIFVLKIILVFNQSIKFHRYVFQVGGVVQERRDQIGTSSGSTAAASTRLATGAASVASNIGGKLGQLGRMAGNAGYTIITTPLTGWLRSSQLVFMFTFGLIDLHLIPQPAST